MYKSCNHILSIQNYLLDTYFGSISNYQRSPSISGSTQHVISGHYCHIIVNFVYKTKAWGEITLLKLDIWPSQFSGAGGWVKVDGCSKCQDTDKEDTNNDSDSEDHIHCQQCHAHHSLLHQGATVHFNWVCSILQHWFWSSGFWRPEQWNRTMSANLIDCNCFHHSNLLSQ